MIHALVDSLDKAIGNIKRYQSEVQEEPRLSGRMKQVRAWYAIGLDDGSWVFAPSKFAGYASSTAETYLSKTDRRNTCQSEAVLKEWFAVVSPNTPLGKKLASTLRSFLNAHGHSGPRKNSWICVRKEVLSGSADTVNQGGSSSHPRGPRDLQRATAYPGHSGPGVRYPGFVGQWGVAIGHPHRLSLPERRRSQGGAGLWCGRDGAPRHPCRLTVHFLIDAQLPPDLARWLAERGHRSDHVNDLGLGAAPDDEIEAKACEMQAVIWSNDADFAERARRAPGRQVVWLRVGDTTNASLRAGLASQLAAIEAALSNGESLIEIR